MLCVKMDTEKGKEGKAVSNKEKVIALLDSVPEYKMGYLLAYVQGLTADEENAENLQDENYCIEKEQDAVHAYAKSYIPFETNISWIKKFRNALRQALKEQLRPVSDLCLMANYSGPAAGMADLENILFYNIGTSSFSALGAQELRMEIAGPSSRQEYPHYYCYQCRNVKTLPEPQWKKEPAVTWENVETTGFSSSKKPFDYWLSLLKSPEKIKIYRTVPKGQNFGLEIRISVPAESKLDLACAIKALLDGAICAFHGADASMREQAEAIAARLGISSQVLFQTKDVLGPRRFVELFRDGVKWNPQDDYCMAARLVLMRSNKGTSSFSGGIYLLP